MVSKTKIKETIFQILKNYGLEVTDIKVGNGYFLFDFGDNSVVHFKIKGCKRWLFGMWITYIDKDNDGKEACDGSKMKQGYLIELFGQHEDYIDKFKPSHSPIDYAVKGFMKLGDPGKDGTDYGMWWPVRQFVDDIFIIKKYPIFATLHFNMNDIDVNNIYSKKTLLSIYLKETFYYRIKKPIHEFLDKDINRIYGKILTKWIGFWNKKYLVTEFVDMTCDGFVCYPPFKIHIRYKTNDHERMWNLYHKYYGEKVNIGFYKDIRVEHFDSLDAKRSFYYPDNEEDS